MLVCTHLVHQREIQPPWECQFPHTMCALNFWPHIKRWIWFDSHFCLRFIRLPPWFERILRIEVCVSLLLAITDDRFIFVMKSCGQCDSTCRMSFWFNAIDRQNDEDFIILQYYHICINLSEIFLKYLYIIDHYIMIINYGHVLLWESSNPGGRRQVISQPLCK